MVLTGDSLLVGDVGRPDFGGGDPSAQFESISKLLRLPDWVAVFPGHFEGPCGKGMCGRPSTTIGFERRFNPMLAEMTEDRFVKLANADLALCGVRGREAMLRRMLDRVGSHYDLIILDCPPALSLL